MNRNCPTFHVKKLSLFALFTPLILLLILNSSIIQPSSLDYNGSVMVNPLSSTITLPSDPNPKNSSTFAYKNLKLEWKKVENATGQNIFMGNSESNLTCICEGYLNSSYKVGLVQENQWYFWRIDSLINGINVTGNVWRFFVPGLKTYPTDGNPIGGGYGYKTILQNYDYLVSTNVEFLDALSKVKKNETIYLADNASIDLTGKSNLIIPANVTIASSRGKTLENEGGLIFKNDDPNATALFFPENGVRFTGLRLQGPSGFWAKVLSGGGITGSRGIYSNGGFLEVENCEIYNWSYAAIYINHAPGVVHNIHHNYIHDCVGPLGYGIEMGTGSPLIHANIFSRCRHAIAGIGQKDCSYEASYNIALESGHNYDGYAAHVFDMHGSYDHNDLIPPIFAAAGSKIKIHHNTFSNPRSDGTKKPSRNNVADISIRGRPRNECEISNNWFLDENIDHAVYQKRSRGNMNVHNNFVGMNQSPQKEWKATYWPLDGFSLASYGYIVIIGLCIALCTWKLIRSKKNQPIVSQN
jgi:hypothetical protein